MGNKTTSARLEISLSIVRKLFFVKCHFGSRCLWFVFELILLKVLLNYLLEVHLWNIISLVLDFSSCTSMKLILSTMFGLNLFRALELVVFDLFSFVFCLDFISFRNFVFIL